MIYLSFLDFEYLIIIMIPIFIIFYYCLYIIFLNINILNVI